jgi:hypothetical protein
MPSEKQIALADLMHWVTCIARGPQTYGPLSRLIRKKAYDRVLADLYLIHKIPLSILDPDYTENDIMFINWGVKNYVMEIGDSIDPRVADNILRIVDGVPGNLRDRITWTVPDWLRELQQQITDTQQPANQAAHDER